MTKNLIKILFLSIFILVTVYMATSGPPEIFEDSTEGKMQAPAPRVTGKLGISGTHGPISGEKSSFISPSTGMSPSQDPMSPSMAPVLITDRPTDQTPNALTPEDIERQNQPGTPPQSLALPPSDSPPALLR